MAFGNSYVRNKCAACHVKPIPWSFDCGFRSQIWQYKMHKNSPSSLILKQNILFNISQPPAGQRDSVTRFKSFGFFIK